MSSLPSFLRQVSLRKQEIADRLNAWIIFNEKNKELCDWLTQMENKVEHDSDLNIEEMVEKLKKVGGLWGTCSTVWGDLLVWVLGGHVGLGGDMG